MPFMRPVGASEDNQQAPNFIRPLQDKRVTAGQRVVLECQISGRPEPTIKWLKEGQNVTQCPDYIVEQDGNRLRLLIPKVDLNDSGRFTCQALNAAGTKTTSAVLIVAPPPSPVVGSKGLPVAPSPIPPPTPVGPAAPFFLKELKNQPLKIGGSAIFECRVVANPPPQVVWLKNGQPLMPGFRYKVEHDVESGISSLQINMANAEDIGEYTAKTSNPHGTAQASAQLLPKDKYEEWMSEEQTNITREKKRTLLAELDSTVQQPRKPKGTFYRPKSERWLEQRYGAEETQYDSYGSDVQMVSESETEAENLAFSNGSIPFEGTGVPPAIRQPLRDVQLHEGTDAIFQCHLAGNPKPRVQWFKNGKPLPPAQRYITTHKQGLAVLKIKMSFPEDSGEYAFVAENQFGRVQSTANLMVMPFNQQQQQRFQQQPRSADAQRRPPSRTEEPEMPRVQTVRPPQFIRVPTDLTVRERQVARFDLKIVARPYPTVEWYKGTQLIRDSAKHRILVNQEGVHSLLINMTEQSDGGQYTCLAHNSAGESQVSFSLHVNPTQQNMTPIFVEKFPSVAAKEGETIILRCRAVGTPVPILSWMKDNIPLVPGSCAYRIDSGEGESELHIVNAKPEDAGWYQCNAVNSAGTVTLRGRVSFQSKQPPPTAPSPLRMIQPIQRSGPPPAQEPPLRPEVVTLRHVERSKPRLRHEEDDSRVTEPPRFTSEPKSLQLNEGQSAHFETRLTPVNDPNMRVVWLFNGRPIDASSRMSWLFDFGFASLDIFYVYPEDSGTYTCLAGNQIGEAQVSCQMQVSGHTGILEGTQHPTSLHQIEMLENRRLIRMEMTDEDQMSREPPSFKGQLKSCEVLEGKAVHLEAKLLPANDPNMKVEWLHNGSPVQTGSRFRLLHDFGYVALDILYTIPEDSGTYSCRATNSLGTAETIADLICRPQQFGLTADAGWMDQEDWDQAAPATKPPQFGTNFRGANVKEGERSHFEARLAPIGDPFLKVEWFKDGVPLSMASRIHPHFDFGFVALTIQPTYPEDSGVYTCVATNRVGQAETSAQLNCQGKGGVIVQSHHEEAMSQLNYLDSHRIHMGPLANERPEEQDSLESPKFVRPMKEAQEVKEGKNVHFECRLMPVNDPKMVIEWYHNGQLLQSGHRFRPMYDFGYVALDILYAYAEDSGTYTVIARNALGESQCQCLLTVKGKKTLLLDALHPEGLDKIQRLEAPRGPGRTEEPDRVCTGPPKITARFKDVISLKEFSSLHLEARLEPVNDPTMRVEWYLNDRPLHTGSRVAQTTDFGFVALDMNSLIPEDGGLYTVRAINALGEDSASVQVQIQGRSGVVSDTHHAESLQQIQYLESTDKHKRHEAEDVGPKGPPVFVRPLPPTVPTVAEAESVHIECQIQPVSDSTLRVSWYRNGQPVPAGHRFKTFHDFGFVSLDILTTYPEDSGTYTCVLQNAYGEAKSDCQIECHGKQSILSQTHHPSSVQKITALEAPKPIRPEEAERQHGVPQFTLDLKDVQNLREGEFVHVECQVTPNSDPTLKVEWFANGMPLQTGHRFQTTSDFGFCCLNILYVYPEDSGTYTCVARNAAGEAITQCTISCRGKKSMYLESTHPDSMRRIQELEAPKARPQDMPDAPKAAPHFVTQLQSLENLKEGQTAHFECQVQPANDAELRVEWLHNGKPLAAGHRFRTVQDFGYVSLDILYVYPEDSGTYTARILNSQGVAESTCSVSCSGKRQIYNEPNQPESWKRIKQLEEAKPARPSEPEPSRIKPIFVTPLAGPIELREGQSAHLECQVQPVNDNRLRIEWFFNNLPLKHGHRFRTVNDFGYCALDILYAYPEDSGVYMCRAVNDLGEATTNTTVNCHSKRSIFTETQHSESLRQIEQIEQPKRARPTTPEKTFAKPHFSVPLKDFVNLQEGQSVHLETRVQPVGDPNMKVTWLRNGQPLPDGHRFRRSEDFNFICLDILTIYSEDSGVYSVYAVNDAGEATSSCTIKCEPKGSILLNTEHEESWAKIQQLESRHPRERLVEEMPICQPKFVVPLPTLPPMPEGHRVHLEAQLVPTNDPNLKVQWYHNGNPLVAGHRFRLTHDFGYVALDILYAFPEDSGTWVCRAANALGQAETSTKFEIAGKRTIVTDVQHPDSWARIQEIEAPRSIVSPLTEPSPNPPRFTQHIQSIERLEGQRVHFECRLTPISDPTMVVTWHYNGNPLMSSNRFTETYDFGFVSLDIADANVSDAGTYLVQAHNSKGDATSMAELKVKGKSNLLMETLHPASLDKISRLETPAAPPAIVPPRKIPSPRFTQQLNDLRDLIEGQPAHFECRYEPIDDPDLTIEWLHDGKPLAASSRIKWVQDFGFIVMDIQYCLPEDAGRYICRAINKFGHAESYGEIQCRGRTNVYLESLHHQSLDKIRIIEAPKTVAPPPEPAVPQKPTFTQPLQNLDNLIEGSAAHIDCRLTPINDPKMKVEWFFNGQPMPMSNRLHLVNDFGYISLDLSPVYAHDSGVYMCRAVNELGEAVTTASINVQAKQSLFLESQHPESYRKIVQLEGEAKFRRQEIPDKTFNTPVFVQQLNNVENLKEGDAALLECHVTPVGDPKLRVDWYFNGKPLEYGSRFRTENDFGRVTLEILASYPEDSGVYSCKAVNDYGESVTSGTVKVQGYESIQRNTHHPESLEKIMQLERPTVKQQLEPTVTRIKPHFKKPLENHENLNEGDLLHLESQFEPLKDDTLKVEWLRNGLPIPAGQLIKTAHELGWATLDISTVYPEHSGLYTLKLTNSVGDAASSASVKVAGKGGVISGTQHEASWKRIQDIEAPKPIGPTPAEPQFPPPTFVSHLNNVELKEGEKAHFECKVEPSKDPSLKIEFYHNGKPLVAGSKYVVTVDFGFVSLDILYTYPADSGVYMCKAVSSQGEAVTTGTLKCQGKDSIITEAQHAGAAAKIAELEAGKPAAAEAPEKPKVAPIFTGTLPNLTQLQEGQAAHFEATVEPTDVNVEWYHNGQAVTASSRIKMVNDFGWVILDIAQVESRDSGEWVCRAWNQQGETTTKGNLQCAGKVNIILDTQHPQSLARISDLERPKAGPAEAAAKPLQPPKFVVPLSILPPLEEGDSVHLEAQLIPVDDPKMKVEWFHNGRPLSYGHRYRPINDFGFCVLDILYAMAEDSGEFLCKATNEVGSDTTRTVANCASKSGLITKPQIRDDKLKTIMDLEESLHRSYQETPGDRPKVAPVFIEPLKNPPTLKEGENAHFSARITPVDDPELKVEWYLNGRPLISGSRVKTICDFGFCILEIGPVYPEDSGEYMCKAKNSVGEAVTTAHMTCEGKRGIIGESQLPEKIRSGAAQKIREIETPKIPPPAPGDTVYGPPRFITQLQTMNDLLEGQLAHFECQLEPAADPNLQVEWFHNGQPIFHTSRMKMIHDFGFVILEIAPAEPHDSGEYVCRARNQWGEDSTRGMMQVQSGRGVSYEWQMPEHMQRDKITELEAFLHRTPEQLIQPPKDFGPPEFVEGLTSLGEMQEGESAHFECRLEPVGDPTLRIEWLHNGKPIPYGSRIQMQNDFGFMVLNLHGLIPEDTGEYVCRAQNSKGVAETTGSVVCHSRIESEPPQFVTPLIPQIEGIHEGDTVHLECRVTPINDPRLTVHWYFNDQLLSTGHRFKTMYDFGFASLDILYSYPTDQGVYTCKAVNDKGEAVTSTTFNVQPRPGLIFQRQAPKQTQADLERHIRQYTKAEVMLSETDIYEDGKPRAPEFKSQLTNLVSTEGEFVRLECQLAPVNDPNLRVDWFLNGKPVMLGHRFRPTLDFGFAALDVLYALPSDSGQYTARATNQYGTAETTAKLICASQRKIVTGSQIPQGLRVSEVKLEENLYWSETIEAGDQPRVKSAPVFTIPPRSTQVQEDESVRFEVAVQGFPRPRVQWFINGKEAVTGSQYKLSFDGMYYLVIPQAKPTDAGEVVVVARNAVGEAQAQASLDIFLAQDFRRHQLKTTPRAGEFENLQKEDEWRRQMLGTLGQAFEQAPKPDAFKLHKLDEIKKVAYPLETDELKLKFQRRHEEDFYESIQVADHPRPAIPPLGMIESVELKPAHVVRRELPKEELPVIELRSAPRNDRTSDIPPEGPMYIQPHWKPKSERDEEKFRQKPFVQREVEVAAKDQVTLKRAQIRMPLESEHVVLEKAKLNRVEPSRPAPIVPKAKEEPPAADTVQLKSTFKPKAAPTATETVTLEQTQLKSTTAVGVSKAATVAPAPTAVPQPRQPSPPKQIQQKAQEKIVDEKVTMKVDHKTEVRDIGGKKVNVSTTKHITEKLTTSETVQQQAEETVAPPPKAGSKQAPIFTKKVLPCKAEIGRPGSFSCEFTGSQPMTVTWLREGEIITSSFDTQITTTNKVSTLSIAKVKPEHAGNYTARLENVAGKSESTANLLAVERADTSSAPTFSQIMSSASVAQGRPARFEVKISGKPEPNVTWFKDGRQIMPDIRFKMLAEEGVYTLLIIEALPQDAGTYECIAKNQRGESRCRATLSVTMSKVAPGHGPGDKSNSHECQLIPPEILEPIRPLIVVEGKPAKFVAKITGVPDPDIKWFRNGAQIKPSKFFVMTHSNDTCTLEVKECFQEDEGEYKCEATNTAGKSTCTASLRLQPKATVVTVSGNPPMYQRSLKDVVVNKGQTAKFTADVVAVPKPQVKWLHDGKPLQNSNATRISTSGNTYSLEIVNVQAAQAGKYTLELSNELGDAESSAQLRIVEST